MRLVVTCNGPGETAGWLLPLLRELYGRARDTDVHVFFVPDDYATGEEPEIVRAAYPNAHVYGSKAYLRAAFGARVKGLPAADAVLYLGGDLMHAARLRKRFGGALTTYKFSRPRYARAIARAFAVDERNAAELAKCGVPADRVRLVGNLAIDGALIESAGRPDPGSPSGGILVMPGSRAYEVRHLVPFFFTAALAMRRGNAGMPIAFGISPFTQLDAVRAAVEGGGHPRFFAQPGTLLERDGQSFLASLDGTVRFPIVRHALPAARQARLVLTIPGTKVIELAAIGTPVIACTPLNAPELAAINGPLTYLDRLPLIGVAAKRAAVAAYSRRHRYHTQPNIDAQASIVHELHGTLTPGRVARVVLERAADDAWLSGTSKRLSVLYRNHIGAAARMAAGILSLHTPGES